MKSIFNNVSIGNYTIEEHWRKGFGVFFLCNAKTNEFELTTVRVDFYLWKWVMFFCHKIDYKEK